MKTDEAQMPIDFSGGLQSEGRWLGLAIDNRRLFDALQEGWLRPRCSWGQAVGVGAYAEDGPLPDGGHPIRVHARVDRAKLPDIEIDVLRGDDWRPCRLDQLEPADHALYWPGALPAFAISEIAVSNEEQRARLVGMAGRASNLALSEELVRVDSRAGARVDVRRPPNERTTGIGIPDDLDAIHGAVSMAVWGVPRIDLWLDLLAASLGPRRMGVAGLAAKVDATWWGVPPWEQRPDDVGRRGLQDRLWWAAAEVFRGQASGARVDSRELAMRIHEEVLRGRAGGDSRGETTAWLDATTRMLRAESVVQLQDWRRCPVGIAIQLVLARPAPARFKTWFKDMPQIPPGIAWSAAALCGLLHGYRGLDVQFRGEALQRELLSIRALSLAGGGSCGIRWPTVQVERPRWRRVGGNIIMAWGGRDFFTATEHARGRWFGADFRDARVRDSALKLATAREWPCIFSELVLRNVRIACAGSGTVRPVSGSEARVEVQGEVRMRLPGNEVVEKGIDVDGFRRLVATEAGPLPAPPDASAAGGDAERAAIPGLMYVRDFLSPDDEKTLVTRIDRHEWNGELSRRVQHYGWRYDYKARHIDPSMQLGPLPDWADVLAERLVSEGLLSQRPDQVIVNEYIGDQSISAHVDSDSFGDSIATVSLLESWVMIFRKRKANAKVEQRLDRRSVAIMSGEARYGWTHELPKRKSEPGGPGEKRQKRRRRISLTFRKVNRSPSL